MRRQPATFGVGAIALVLAALLSGSRAGAQPAPLVSVGASASPGSAASGGPAADLVARVDVEQRLGEPLPLDARFRDESGAEVTLGSYFGERPVVLALVYYECPMLCTLVLNGLIRAARPLRLEAGRDFDVVVLSFDPGETPALASAKKVNVMDAYGRPGTESGWHFLTGEPAAIEAVTGALGFRYVYDPQRDEYAHAAAVFVATAQGRIARYLFGVEYASRDLQLAVVDAGEGTVGTLVDRLLLLCYHYDPSTGKYSRAAIGVMRVAGVVTIVAIGGMFFAMRRREQARG